MALYDANKKCMYGCVNVHIQRRLLVGRLLGWWVWVGELVSMWVEMVAMWLGGLICRLMDQRWFVNS